MSVYSNISYTNLEQVAKNKLLRYHKDHRQERALRDGAT